MKYHICPFPKLFSCPPPSSIPSQIYGLLFVCLLFYHFMTVCFPNIHVFEIFLSQGTPYYTYAPRENYLPLSQQLIIANSLPVTGGILWPTPWDLA